MAAQGYARYGDAEFRKSSCQRLENRLRDIAEGVEELHTYYA